MQLVADPGTIPFRVLTLIGRGRSELPGPPTAWEEVWTGEETGGVGARLRWTLGRGQLSGGEPVAIHVYVRLFNDVVWAVGVDAPGVLFAAETSGEGAPYLITIDRPAEHPEPLINWIGHDAESVINLGLSA